MIFNIFIFFNLSIMIQAGGAQGGWPAYASDRPKSANFSGNAGGNGTGLMASLTGGGRPSSSQQPAMGGTNWSAQQQMQMQATGGGNSNALSYGSLKNRFLSGPTKSGAPSSGNSGNGAKTSSKLFSLAR